MFFTYYCSLVCAEYSVMTFLSLICLWTTEKSTNVRACQNFSRAPKILRPQRVNTHLQRSVRCRGCQSRNESCCCFQSSPGTFICKLQELILSIRSKDLKKLIHLPAHRPSPWRNQYRNDWKWTKESHLSHPKETEHEISIWAPEFLIKPNNMCYIHLLCAEISREIVSTSMKPIWEFPEQWGSKICTIKVSSGPLEENT